MAAGVYARPPQLQVDRSLSAAPFCQDGGVWILSLPRRRDMWDASCGPGPIDGPAPPLGGLLGRLFALECAWIGAALYAFVCETRLFCRPSSRESWFRRRLSVNAWAMTVSVRVGLKSCSPHAIDTQLGELCHLCRKYVDVFRAPLLVVRPSSAHTCFGGGDGGALYMMLLPRDKFARTTAMRVWIRMCTACEWSDGAE